MEFQSLLCWITQSFCAGGATPSRSSSSFNPCCVGSPSPSVAGAGTEHLPSGVSIPVVLDHPVLHWFARAKAVLARAFQSLLCWITQSFILDAHGGRMPEAGFQSLLCWITQSFGCGFLAARGGAKWFQSLLCWITQSFTQTPRWRPHRLRQFQSLLCWITQSFSWLSFWSGEPVMVFQSLLCWITQSFAGFPSGRASPSWCFNPCCVGSPSPSRSWPLPLPWMFDVSIPVVLDHPVLHLAQYRRGVPALAFQSLLCWITQSFTLTQLLACAANSCFNPCCVGSPSPSFLPSLGADRRATVSIPVVLDHPVLPSRRPSGLGATAAEFQSLLCWITQSFPTPLRLTTQAPAGFNPCCVGSPSPSTIGRLARRASAKGFNPCCVGSPSPSRGRPLR